MQTPGCTCWPCTDSGVSNGANRLWHVAGGELPPLQASALLVLRRGVLQGLAEAGQRKLLERLANLLDKRLVTPAAVVTLEGGYWVGTGCT